MRIKLRRHSPLTTVSLYVGLIGTAIVGAKVLLYVGAGALAVMGWMAVVPLVAIALMFEVSFTQPPSWGELERRGNSVIKTAKKMQPDPLAPKSDLELGQDIAALEARLQSLEDGQADTEKRVDNLLRWRCC